jgi:hypothetical protein
MPDHVHGNLARKDVGTPMGAHSQFRVTPLPHVEVFAYVLADKLDCRWHCQGIKDHHPWM